MVNLDQQSSLDGLPFGQFFLFGEIGGGQMIEVWIAGALKDTGERQACIIKRVNPRYREFKAAHDLLNDEVYLSSSIEHPSIIKVLSHGTIDGLTYVSLELVDGIALSQIGHLVSAPLLPLGAVLELGIHIASGLHAAHVSAEQPIVHGRLTPANILFTRDGEVKLADIGLRAASYRNAKGSLIPSSAELGYLGPEMHTEQDAAPTSDIFSLGTILIESCCGRRLFPEGPSIVVNQSQLVRNMCKKAPLELVPDELVNLLIKMTSFDANERPRDCEMIRDELEAIAKEQDQPMTVGVYLQSQVFVQLPDLFEASNESTSESGRVTTEITEPAEYSESEAELDPSEMRNALLGNAVTRKKSRPHSASFPTTGAVLLDDVVYESTVEFREIPPRLPSSALFPAEQPPQMSEEVEFRVSAADKEEPTIPPLLSEAPSPAGHLAKGTYRLQGKGLSFLLRYDPLLRAMNIVEDQIDEVMDTRSNEFYFRLGDSDGARIIWKSLTSRIYRDQQVVLLEGSRLFNENLDSVLENSKFLPNNVVSARGESVLIQHDGSMSEELFLVTHEQRRPRPSLGPREKTQTRDRFLKFFGMSN